MMTPDETLISYSTSDTWHVVHEALSRIAREEASRDFEKGEWLRRAFRERVYVHLGLGSFQEYVGRLFGYEPRMVGDRLRVAEDLVELPTLAHALREGTLPWTAIRELTRVATPETEDEWLEVSKGKTVREIEGLVAGMRRGDRPTDAAQDEARRHVLRFEVEGETLASFRDARAMLEREVGHSLTDDAVLFLLTRRALGGPTDEGRANYQVALSVCKRCGSGTQQAHGHEVAVSAEVVEMAQCDAQTLPSPTHVGSTHVGRATQTIPPATRRHVVRRDHGRCVVPGCRAARFLDVHHLHPREEGGNHDPDNLVLLCGAHHRVLHNGFLVIDGRVSSGLTFLHADGTTYGGAVSPRDADIAAQAFGALRNLGFRESEARQGVAAARTHVGQGLEAVIRHALGALAG